MQKHSGIRRRMLAVGLVGAIGVLRGGPVCAISEQPPTEGILRVAAAIGTPSEVPAQKNDPAAPPRAAHIEIPDDVLLRCKAATALVELRSMGSGSAVCVSAEGLFVTNHHVVSSAGLGHNVRLVVRPGQGNQRMLDARVIKLDDDNDLALLKVDPPRDLVVIPLGKDDELVETMPLAAFGYPFGRMLAADNGYPTVSVTTGTITALRKKAGKLSNIQLDASVNPGNSGGPVVDKKGELLGIVVSGFMGAQLNFAIPVSVVREFLAGPALVLRIPQVTFRERTKPRPFEIDAYAFEPRVLENLVVELALAEPGAETRTLTAKRRGNQFVAEGSPCAPDEAPPQPNLVVYKGRGKIKTKLPPGEFSIGSRRFSWQDVSWLLNDGDEWVVSLLDGKRFAGKPKGLPSVSYGAGQTTQLATADRIEMRLDKTPATEVAYEVQSHRGSQLFAPIHGRLRINNTPAGLTPRFDRPIARTQIRLPIVIEAVVQETLELAVSPGGLTWMHAGGAPPGMEDERGRYLLVNGQPWYGEQALSTLPIIFGVRDCQIGLLWARPEGDGPHNGERVAVDVKKAPRGAGMTVTVSNRVGQPSRIALAIAFDPPGEIVAILPPRTQPVLESHWPLDDADPTRATDLGPGKHHGRTSFAHTVPGFRGNGLQLDRQVILCPGVLAIDRDNAFSCAAWMKAARGEHVTVFSRMNNGLRGFDLEYNGVMGAHLISSWDGNAVAVNTLERFDPLEWHHVAVTYDGSSLARGWKIYVDGALAPLVLTHDRLSETIRSDFPFTIGGRERRDYYRGFVDEVRAYDRVLTDEDIFEMYDLDCSKVDPPAGSTLTQGLVGHWSFDGSPADSLRDKSGHGHDGKPEDDLGLPQIVASDGGQVLRLDGQGMVDCGAMADFERTDSYSLGAWFNARGDSTRTLMGTLDQVLRGFDMVFDGGRIICHLISQWEGSAIKIITRATYPNDTWHHVLCTYDGSSRSAGFKLYVDGAESPFDASHDNLTTSTKCHGYFRIGARVAQHYFNGDMDDVFVYGRAISADEARAWFARGRNSAQGLSAQEQRSLLGFWTFEGTGGEAFRDRSGNGHHGQPDVHAGHSAIVPQGSTRVARFRSIGGIECGQAGDFERTDAFSAGGYFCWEGGPNETLLSKIEYGIPNRGYDIEYDGERYIAQVTSLWDEGPGHSVAIRSGPIRGTGWRHVLFTYNGSSRVSGLKLYVNGELQKDVTVLKDNLTTGSIRIVEPFMIGSRFTARTMRGRAAQVRLIPRELTAKEVRELAKADQPPGTLP